MPATVLAATTQTSGAISQGLFFVVLIAAFYFLIIRPQKNRAKLIRDVQQSIGVGAEVITTSGIYGRIVADNDDDTLLVEVAPGMPLRFARTAILRTVTPIGAEEIAPADRDEPPATS